MILYYPLLPFFLYFLIEILIYIRKILLEKKINNKEPKNHFKILDPYPFLNLGQIEHIFLDKTGTITQNNYKIKMIYFDSKLYSFNQKNFTKNLEKNKKLLIKKSISPKKNLEIPRISTNFVVHKKEIPLESFIEATKKEQPLSDFIEIPTYSLEKYTPPHDKIDNKKMNIPNQLPSPIFVKHFPYQNNKKQLVYFVQTRAQGDDGSLLYEEEETATKPEITLTTHNKELPKFVNILKKKNQKVSEDNICYESFQHTKRNFPNNASFDFSIENIGTIKSHHFLNSSNSSIRSLLANEPKIKKYTNCSEDDFLNNLIKIPNYLDPLFEAFTLCHSAKISENNEIYSSKPEEEVILKFSGLCEHKFEKAHMNNETCEYHMKNHQRKTIYNIYNWNEYSNDNKNFSVLYQDPKNSNQAILLSRGPLGYIKKRLLLNDEELENLELLVKEFFIKGLIALIYAKKTINHSDTKEILDKLNIFKSSPINYSEEIKMLISELEKDLIFIGIVGIKDKLNEGIKESLSFFKEINQRIWIVSGDSRDNCLSTALSLNFIKFNENYYEIESENKTALILSFQNHLEDIKETFFQMNSHNPQNNERASIIKPIGRRNPSVTNFFRLITSSHNKSVAGVSYILENKYILLNGKSLEIIKQDDYLRLHFIFLISLIKKFVCYSLTAEQKAYLVSLVEDKLINNPKTMAVGDGWNDALMLQKASIGIEYIIPQKFNEKEGFMNAGDIQISNLNLIKKLLIEAVINISVMEQLLLYFFYKTNMIIFPLFLFNWICNFSATNLYSQGYILSIDLLLSLHNIVVFFICEEPIGKVFLEKYPLLYKNGSIKKQQVILRFFLGACIEGLIQSGFIFYVTFYTCGLSNGPHGKQMDIKLASSSLVISLSIASNARIFMDTNNKKSKMLMLFCPMTLILLTLFFFVQQFCFLFTCYDSFFEMNFIEFARDTSIFVCGIGNIIFSICSHYLIQNFMFRKYGGSPYYSFISSTNIFKRIEILNNIKSNLPYLFLFIFSKFFILCFQEKFMKLSKKPSEKKSLNI